MTIRYFIILLLPVILHSKGNQVVLVFLIMNTFINILSQYTIGQIRVLGSIIGNEDRIDKLINQGVEYDEAFKEHLENVDTDIYIPKPIDITATISMTISLLAIIVGVVKVIENII